MGIPIQALLHDSVIPALCFVIRLCRELDSCVSISSDMQDGIWGGSQLFSNSKFRTWVFFGWLAGSEVHRVTTF